MGTWFAESSAFFFYFLLVAVLLLGFLLRPRRPKSGFRVRESDLPPKKAASPARPLRLTGISIDGPPHQILGIPKDASRKEVLRAYRNLMKIHHPDKVGPPESAAWQDAQKIAVALTRARNALLKDK